MTQTDKAQEFEDEAIMDDLFMMDAMMATGAV